MRRLLLWDVDGTLVRGSGAGRSVFGAAVERALERELAPDVLPRVRMSGKTDPQIARELLALAEVADADADTHLPAVLRHLEDEVARAAERFRTEGHVLPGVRDLLARLDAEPGVVQTVLTGNLAPNAAVKLGAFGLERWLDLSIGAYGSDDEDRTRLVPLARGRAAARDGVEVAPEAAWVIGDTPRDLACARAGGVRCLLVATGNYRLEELAAAGPDAVREDLADVDEVAALLTA
jgi:phosphoglycolate phosphatase-like HAD superfamily hydrolase